MKLQKEKKKNVNQTEYDMVLFVVLLLYVPVNSYGHYRTFSSPNHTFSLANIVDDTKKQKNIKMSKGVFKFKTFTILPKYG